jgi:hypothetical protein
MVGEVGTLEGDYLLISSGFSISHEARSLNLPLSSFPFAPCGPQFSSTTMYEPSLSLEQLSTAIGDLSATVKAQEIIIARLQAQNRAFFPGRLANIQVPPR